MASHKYMTSPPNLTGMPPGVPYIIGNEAAERFSYYGMKSVLTVFMAHYILNQSGLLAPMQENEAYMYSHFFVLGVYALPVFGAILADGFLGKYRTILSLSLVYCLGNLTLACMATKWGIAIGQRTMLVIGLTLICLGSASMFQMELIHGPTPTTTSSHAIVPAEVSTAVIAVAPLPLRNPVTVTPATISTPNVVAFPARPRIDAMLFA